MQVILSAPYLYTPLPGVRAVTIDTGDRRGIVTVNHPVGVYGSVNSGRTTVRGQNHSGTSVSFGLSGRILSIVTREGETEVIPNI